MFFSLLFLLFAAINFQSTFHAHAPYVQEVYRGESIAQKLDPLKFAPHENVCRIFLIRHGETEWNKEERPQGWNDIPLNDDGRRQAELLAEHFSELSISEIYTSALSRAVETAELLAIFHPDAKIVYDRALRFYDPTAKKLVDEKEIAQDIAEKAQDYLKKISQTHKGENVVIITHGKVIKHLFQSLNKEGFSTPVKIDNGAMIRVLGKDNTLSLEY